MHLFIYAQRGQARPPLILGYSLTATRKRYEIILLEERFVIIS